MDGLYNFLNYFVTGTGFVFELLICEILLSLHNMEFRKWPWLTVPAAIAAYLAFGLFCPDFYLGGYGFAIRTMCIVVLFVLLQWAVLKTPIDRIVFNTIAAHALLTFIVGAREAVIYLTGWTGWTMLSVHYLMGIVLFAIAYFVNWRYARRGELHIKRRYIYGILTPIMIALNMLFSACFFNLESSWEAMLLLAIAGWLLLMLQVTGFSREAAIKEQEVLEQILKMEQRQHALSQEMIDIINIKAHDLKHQIALLKKLSGGEMREDVREVEESVNFYDNMADTGNKSLDLIINEVKLRCEKYGLKLDVMADGALLEFITPTDLYSLFGNALRNAVESVAEEEEPLRLIEMNIHKNGEYICCEVKNYCSRQVDFKDGRPVTSKDDANFHGFGTRSMEYVVEKYGGNMVFDCSDNTFRVKIIFPVSKQ